MYTTEFLNKMATVFAKQTFFLALRSFKTLWFFKSYYINFMKAKKLREKKSEKENIQTPLFIIASIAGSCNLLCDGCYAHANKICSDKTDDDEMSDDRWEYIFQEASKIGVSYILIAGGEPFTKYGVIEKASHVKNIIFPVFTNATMFNEKYISLFDKNRNLIPVISIEGERRETNERRGEGVYEKVINAMKKLKEKNIIFGVSLTVGKENIDKILDKGFIKDLENKGVSFFVYVEYVDIEKSKISALDEDERDKFEKTIYEHRKKSKSMFITFPGDEKLFGGCLAAGRGFFHINSKGSAEPCPFSPYSDISLKNSSIIEALKSPLFYKIRTSEVLKGEHKGGCVLFEKDDTVKKIAES